MNLSRIWQVSLALGVLILMGCDGGDDRPAEAAPSRAVSDALGSLTSHVEALDPAGYRGEIEALEKALHGGGSASDAARAEIASGLRELAADVSSENTVLTRALGAELDELADRTAAGLDLAVVATHWTRIRDGLFRHADWFRSGSRVAMR